MPEKIKNNKIILCINYSKKAKLQVVFTKTIPAMTKRYQLLIALIFLLTIRGLG